MGLSLDQKTEEPDTLGRDGIWSAIILHAFTDKIDVSDLPSCGHAHKDLSHNQDPSPKIPDTCKA
jgi:hypothetical protein